METRADLNQSTLALLEKSDISEEGISAITITAEKSPYFAELLNDAAKKNVSITLNEKQQGTYTEKQSNGKIVVVIDKSFDPGNQNNGITNIDKNPIIFATVLAHELGHALLPGGNEGTPANDPAKAAITGDNNEGVGLTTEYIVAKQSGLGAPQTGYMHSDNGQGNQPAPGTLTALLDDAAIQI
ncbi:hypothetical protein [Noviherbaspirillum pedocola]|uniref:Uncharacterized protein n=1 Tax=Noviherbaspirillum pedocola TaxID=2801341 RepID=A0A934W528_9BURK|nr:hypothetical protein [Noviherbaspirillum pedocola]MBK4733450.1 hypothetical protein [Noviherbaspirillum pedocola]